MQFGLNAGSNGRAIVLMGNASFPLPREIGPRRRADGTRWSLVYLAAYSPELQPLYPPFRVLRGSVTHSHHRMTLDAIQADAEDFLQVRRCQHRVLRIIGSPFALAVHRHGVRRPA
jgi:hypothetical protein